MRVSGIVTAGLLLVSVWADHAVAQQKLDPLSAYAVCIAAVYQELAEEKTKPTETFVTARTACTKLREKLTNQLRPAWGDKTDAALLALDVEMVKVLMAGDRLVMRPCIRTDGRVVRSGTVEKTPKGETLECYDGGFISWK